MTETNIHIYIYTYFFKMLYSVLVFVGFLPFKNTSGCTWFEPNSTEFWSLLRSSEFDCIKCWCYFRQAKHKIRWSASDCLCSACPWGVWPAISTQDSNRKTHRWTLQQQTQLHCWNNCMSKHIKWSPAWHQCGSTDCNLVMIRIQRDSTSSSREHHGKRHDVVPMLHWLHVHSTTWPEIMWIMLCHPNVRGKTTLPGRAANAGQKHITKSLSANATSKRTATPRKTRVQSASPKKPDVSAHPASLRRTHFEQLRPFRNSDRTIFPQVRADTFPLWRKKRVRWFVLYVHIHWSSFDIRPVRWAFAIFVIAQFFKEQIEFVRDSEWKPPKSLAETSTPWGLTC